MATVEREQEQGQGQGQGQTADETAAEAARSCTYCGAEGRRCVRSRGHQGQHAFETILARDQRPAQADGKPAQIRHRYRLRQRTRPA